MLKPPPPAAAQGMGYQKAGIRTGVGVDCRHPDVDCGCPRWGLTAVPAACPSLPFFSSSFFPPISVASVFFFSSITLYLCNMKHETKLYICSAGHSLHFFSNLKR